MAENVRSEMQPWMLNTWYVAAQSEEVTHRPLGRKVCDQAMVLWRDGSGNVNALEDFCPHRGAPLSLGSLCDGVLTCGYHGLQVDGAGQTIAMPGQRVSSFSRVRAFPVREKAGFVWIWPGDPAAADSNMLPLLPWADNSQWAYGGGLFHIQCDYRLMIDNLMDLTHERYVHSESIGQKEIDEAPVRSAKDGDKITTRRFMNSVLAPPFWSTAMSKVGLPEGALVDRWQICRFSLPSHVMIEVGVALAGYGGYDAPDEKKVSSVVVDFITPETPTSHWYFWGMARKFNVADQTITKFIRDGQERIFSEDLEMLERQQANLLLYPDRRLMKLNIDAGGAYSRMAIQKAILAENSPEAK